AKLRSKRASHSITTYPSGRSRKNKQAAARLTYRSCPNAAPQARSEFCGAKAAQHAFFASFLARARKDVARRGETRPANKKSNKKAATARQA
ncbi:MAG TPA: hypothetical protein PLB24_01790, partial [Comamonas denitrificans]|nr:hypothetical protein [Comamonas denitrificans]